MKLSIRAYARHRGISDNAVRKAIKKGRIIPDENGKLDPTVADEQWEANSDPAQVHSVKSEPAENLEASRGALEPNYQKSRAIHEAYNARLAKLQYEKESGQLIGLEEVKVNWFKAGRIVRDRILNVADRVGPMLVGKTDVKEIKHLLKEALIHALEEVSSTYVSPT